MTRKSCGSIDTIIEMAAGFQLKYMNNGKTMSPKKVYLFNGPVIFIYIIVPVKNCSVPLSGTILTTHRK